MSEIVVNLRNIHAPLTGVQRYTREIVRRLDGAVQTIDPGPLGGARGHAWEQFVLPRRLQGRLLWSPGNTGPLAVSRQVVTIHDVSTFDYPEAMSPAFGAWYRFLLPKLARRARHIITVSEFAKERIVERLGVSRDRVSVVYNGVDHELFRPRSETEIEALTAPLTLPTQHYVLSVLSTFAGHKNPIALFRAWEIAYPQLPPDYFLVVVGDASNRRIFAAPEYGEEPVKRLWLTGYLESSLLPALYSGATAFAYSSLYDSFALPVVEAMASGAPVIASRSAALPEVCGDAGLLVDGNDPEEIAAAIVRVVSDAALRSELRSLGLERARLFDWDATARDTLEILQKAAQND